MNKTANDNSDHKMPTPVNNFAPTTQFLAYDLDYFWNITQSDIAALVHLGALTATPGIDVCGQASFNVELVEAIRAYAILCRHKAKGDWGPALVKRVKNVKADSDRLVDLVGCFAIAAARSRPNRHYELRPLPGFRADNRRISYGIVMHKFEEYTRGYGPA